MAQNGPRFGLILTLAEVPSEVKAAAQIADQIMSSWSALDGSGHRGLSI